MLDVKTPNPEHSREILTNIVRMLSGLGPDALVAIKMTEHRTETPGETRTVIDVTFKTAPEIIDARINGLESAMNELRMELEAGDNLVAFLKSQRESMNRGADNAEEKAE